MGTSDEWEDAEARGEALRRKVGAEEEAAGERSPGKAAVINRPQAQDPIDDIEDWDIFAPFTEDELARHRERETLRANTPLVPLPGRGKSQELALKRIKEAYPPELDDHTWPDDNALCASKFRDEWNALWSSYYGHFEDRTVIPCMKFTDEPAPPGTHPCSTIQMFSAKVTGIGGGLQWPLDVFGMVAIRDDVDHRRNIVFDRTRDNCQTLTEKDAYLVLTGPTRAVVLMDHVTIEVKLIVKGNVESEDKILSYLAVEPCTDPTFCSRLLIKLCNPFTQPTAHGLTDYTSMLSTLEFTLGHIVSSVEATIFLQVIDGAWPDGFCGRFVARTASIDQEVVLLHSGDKIVPFADDGNLKLSRCVVSVEYNGKLQVSVKAWKADNNSDEKPEVLVPEETSKVCVEETGVHAPGVAGSSVEEKVVFTPKEAGRSDDTLDIGFCKIKATIAWSLIWRDTVAYLIQL
ncbi:LOW QUALITY PROTEIN: hypothetical protein U9M48_015991 [Paspalum notatum var. saurae]|uniref:DUF6598 domain-containing protein n=1 Tax=Paspalum notatum var. saurae TaxID=547442 RepID=A0AAQ3WMD4_PASNO